MEKLIIFYLNKEAFGTLNWVVCETYVNQTVELNRFENRADAITFAFEQGPLVMETEWAGVNSQQVVEALKLLTPYLRALGG